MVFLDELERSCFRWARRYSCQVNVFRWLASIQIHSPPLIPRHGICLACADRVSSHAVACHRTAWHGLCFVSKRSVPPRGNTDFAHDVMSINFMSAGCPPSATAAAVEACSVFRAYLPVTCHRFRPKYRRQGEAIGGMPTLPLLCELRMGDGTAGGHR